MTTQTITTTDATKTHDTISEPFFNGGTEISKHPPPEFDRESTPVPQSPRRVHGVAWLLVVVATLSSVLLYAFDNTIVANVIPTVINDLGHEEQLPWLSVGFLVGGISVILPFGKLYGLFNAKWLYIFSTVLFMAGSALCGGAPTMDAMIVGRVIAGMGGNGMYLGVMTLLSVSTTEKERPMYLGLIGLVFGAGTVVGPVIGGGFAGSSATWRWSFYMNLVTGGVFAPVYAFMLPSFDPKPAQSYATRWKQFDYVGSILSIGTMVCIIMAISFGGTTYAWGEGQIIALFIVAAVLFGAFAAQQATSFLMKPDERIFPVHFFKKPEPFLLFVLAAISNTGGFVPIYYIPLFFQFTRGDTAVHSSIRLLPIIFMIVFAIMFNGGLMSKYGYYQPWYIAGSILALVGGTLMSTIHTDTSAAKIYGYEILLGLGAGCYIQAGFAVIQAILGPTEMAYGIVFMMLGQLLGIGFGLSISGAIFINEALNGVTKLFPHVPRTQLQRAISGVSGSFFQSQPLELQTKALDTIVSSLKKVFIQVYVAFALGLIFSAFLKRRKLPAQKVE